MSAIFQLTSCPEGRQSWFVSGKFSDYSGESNWQFGLSNLALDIPAGVSSSTQRPFLESVL